MSRVSIKEKMKHFCDKQQLFSGFIGAVLTAIVSIAIMFANSNNVATNYISIDSFDVLVEKYFIRTGLVSEDILELDLEGQFDLIENSFHNIKSESESYKTGIEDILILNGVKTEAMSADEMCAAVKDIMNALQEQNLALASENVLLESENTELKEQTMANIMKADLVVDGEQLDTNIPNSVANINGHLFYSETFLNSFLDEKLSYDVASSKAYYGEARAEKIVFQTDMITDIDGFDTYAVGNGNSFTMGTDVYDNGFVKKSTSYSFFYANLKGEYSKISFDVGHIDGSRLENVTLYVYTKNGNEKYRLQKSFELTPDMFPEEKEV